MFKLFMQAVKPKPKKTINIGKMVGTVTIDDEPIQWEVHGYHDRELGWYIEANHRMDSIIQKSKQGGVFKFPGKEHIWVNFDRVKGFDMQWQDYYVEAK